jgi:SulP family sulfate permease
MLVLLGLSGLGKVIKYIPYPVTMGFTSGIAVIIFVGEIKDFLELPIEHLDPDFLPKMQQYLENLHSLNWTALAIGLGVVLIMVFWPARWQRRLPASMAALVIASLVAKWLHLKVSTIGMAHLPDGTFEVSKLKIAQGLPAFHLPHFHPSDISLLMGSAMTVAMLGAIESLLSAVVADGLGNDKHNSSQELIAQGIANIFSPFCGGIAATGAIARTSTNIRFGATSPVSGMIHALILLIIVLVAAPLANAIPMCALAGILVVVAFKMGEWHEFARLRRLPGSDALVFIIVFLLTVLMNLTWGVGVGVVLAALLFIKRVSETSEVTALDATHPETGGRPVWADESWPDGVYLFRVQGAFFFGTADMLETSFRRARARLRVMVLLCEDVYSMDATGLNALESLHERLRRRNQHLILCKVTGQPLEVITQSGFLEELGQDNLAVSVDDALQRARGLLYQPPA